jgi:signal transduction histidine kinase
MWTLDSPDGANRRRILGYCVALLSVTAAFLALAGLDMRWRISANCLMFLFAVIVSAWVGGAKPGLLAVALAACAFDDTIAYHTAFPTGQTPQLAVRVILLAIVASYVVWITVAERDEAERRQCLSRHLLAVQEEERKRLARELHDESGQILAAIGLHLQAAKALVGASARQDLEECQSLLRRACARVRSIALELRPTMLETAGLEAAIRWLAREHRVHAAVEVRISGEIGDVPSEVANGCFRAAQEALTNIVRHARAHHVSLELTQRNGFLELIVRDDGRGFEVPGTIERAARRGSLGLLGMRERVQILGGKLQIDSSPGHGTRIHVTVPCIARMARQTGRAA